MPVSCPDCHGETLDDHMAYERAIYVGRYVICATCRRPIDPSRRLPGWVFNPPPARKEKE